MTVEEAIARIKEHKIKHKMNEPRAIYISEALNMAIEALEQQPCDNERKCKLVKIVPTSDISELLVSDKITYLLDKQTMTVYVPWASCEMLYALGLTIVDLSESEEYQAENDS